MGMFDGTSLRRSGFAPDKRRSRGVYWSIWHPALIRKIMTRLTFGGPNALPVWSPDGRQIAYSSARNGPQMYRKDSSGTGREQLVLEGPGSGALMDWSRDAKRTPTPFLQTPFNEQDGVFSPDGKWIAYDPNESGQTEVYIQAFPPRAANGRYRAVAALIRVGAAMARSCSSGQTNLAT